MAEALSRSRHATARWAAGIIFLVWLTLGDLLLCLFAALNHSAIHDPHTAGRMAPAFAFWFLNILNRDKRDLLGVPLLFPGLVVCFFATLPVVRSCSFESGAHQIAIRTTPLIVPQLLAKAACWVYFHAWGRSHIR